MTENVMAVPKPAVPPWIRVALLFLFLFGFLVAIQMMSGSFKLMGKETSEALFEGVRNPFASLAVGILATVLVQSSSTTTSMIVALVGASSQLSIEVAVPMIMGANIGTTVTNTLVSIGSVRRSQEFQRAFSAATVHDFFNLICVAVMLPLELAFGILSRPATWFTEVIGLGGGGKFDSPVKASVKAVYKLVFSGIEATGVTGTGLAISVLVLGIALTFVCLTLITKNMRVLLAGRIEKAMNRALEKSWVVGVAIGALATIAVQSSSITTSLLVPLCAAGILSLRNAFPIMLGANIGTTVTGLMASMAADEASGLTIALVHTLFNIIGVTLFCGIPRARDLPIKLANMLAEKASRSPLFIAYYVLGVFVVVPVVGWWCFK